MASASKRLRRERKLRRELSIYHRYTRLESQQEVLQTFLKQLQAREFYARATLLAVIAQRGGEVEVTTGTMQQVIDNLKTLSWVQEPKEGDTSTIIIKMVEGEPDVKEQASETDIPDNSSNHSALPVVEEGHDLDRFHDEGNPNHYDNPRNPIAD